MKHFLTQVSLLCTQTFNVIVLFGWADESTSSHTYRKAHVVPDVWFRQRWVWFEKFVNLLFFWDKDHCKGAYEYELKRMHLPPSMRGDK